MRQLMATRRERQERRKKKTKVMSSPMPFRKNVRETLCTPSLNPLCLSLVLVYSVTMHIFPKEEEESATGGP